MERVRANKQGESLHTFRIADIEAMDHESLVSRKDLLLSEMNRRSFAVLNTDLRGLRRHKEHNFANEQIERMRDEVEAIKAELNKRGNK